MARRSLEHKLTFIVELTIATALLLASAVLIAQRAYLSRQWLIEDLDALAKITANNSMSSLAFRDPGDATEILAALQAQRTIEGACIYDADGNVFATYQQSGLDAPFEPPPVEPEGYRTEGRRLLLFRDIVQNEVHLGTLLLQVNFDPLYQRMYGDILLALLVILVTIALASFLARRLQRRVIGQISGVVQLADQIAAGALPPRMEHATDDEIGDLVRSFNQIVDTTKGVVRQTQTLAHGDYSITIQPRSEKDELSHALIQMTEALKDFHEESTRQNWQKTALSELNKRMRGEQEIEELTQNILNALGEAVEAAVGALYLAEGEGLRFSAGYAWRADAGTPAFHRIGEGLIGQAALERRSLGIDDVPPEACVYRTGIVDVTPRYLVAFPLLREDDLVGVIEWGRVHPFTADQKNLLAQATEAMAIAISSAQSRHRLGQLLETTQQQSEVLQQQQHNLQRTNRELEERTDLLEKQKQEIHRQNRALEDAQLDLERKARELEAASRYKSEFLANMSHELRTPLNSLLILSKLLAENKDGNLSEKQVGFAETIHKAGSDLLLLINDILDLSKVEAGKMEFNIEPVRTRDLCDAFEGIFRHMAEAKGLRFPVVVEKGAPAAIRTDSQRVGQILRNLLSNALKFTQEGEVSVTVRAPREAPEGLDDAAISFAVTDTGIGIPASKLGLIFGAFQQADGTTSRDFGGTGLGLSISKALAQHLGGDLLVESQEGQGSTFTLYLPAAAPGSGEAPTPSTETEESTETSPLPRDDDDDSPLGTAMPIFDDDTEESGEERPCLLVIEDDARFVRIVIDAAAEVGFRCVIAEDGAEGMAMAERIEPAGILLDMMLPRLSGRQVLQRLKQSPNTRQIPVVVVSALDHDQEIMRLGALRFLSKPIEPTAMRDALRQILDLHSNPQRKLLVIEDNARHATTLVNLVRRPGLDVDVCATGQEALDHVRRTDYDCVILDIGLTDMSGFDLLDKIDHDSAGRHVPVIVHTGRDLTRDDEARLRKRAEGIVLKSSDASQALREKVSLFLHLPEESPAPRPKPVEAGPGPDPAPSPAPAPQEAAPPPPESADVAPPPPLPVPAVPDSDTDLRGKRVLIVDDDMRNAYSLAAALDQEDIKHVLASGGAKAITLLDKDSQIDLVLMDIMMPGMDGYETMREIRKDARFANLPIIALTAKAMTGDREKCIEAGATEYLPKPVDIARLLTLMRHLLQQPTAHAR